MIRDTLEYISQGLDLTEDHAYKTMNDIMQGEWTPAQIAGFLMGLKIKGETVNEISGFVRSMREKAVKISAPKNAIDTCGTGGDGLHTFNVSTASAFVAAAAGVPVAKHGNRSVSSKAGSADVLAALGVKIDLPPEKAHVCLEKVGLCFLFAPLYHSSMKHAVTPRREMGVRTVFNILGPMSNPALVKNQVVGAFNLDAAEKMIRVLHNTGSEHVLVVHSKDGMDELSLAGETTVFELKEGEINMFDVAPKDFGLQQADISAIKGGEARDNAAMLIKIFAGSDGPMSDITAFNAGAAIYVGGSNN